MARTQEEIRAYKKAWADKPENKEKRRIYIKQYQADKLTNDPEWRARRNEGASAWAKANVVRRRDSQNAWLGSRREHVKARYQVWRGTRQLYQAVKRAKRVAKEKGLPFDLVHDAIEAPEFCPVLGLKLVYGYAKGTGCQDTSPSLDRIIPHLGYVIGNVRVISHRANTLKSNCTDPAELRAVADDLERLGTMWTIGP